MKLRAVFLLLLLIIAHPIGCVQQAPKDLRRETAWHSAKLLLGIWLLAADVFCIAKHIYEFTQAKSTPHDHALYFSFATLPTVIASIALIVSGARGIDAVRLQELYNQTIQNKKIKHIINQ